jgi:hypothetical protein
MLARDVGAAGKGRIRDDPTATDDARRSSSRTTRSRFCTRWTSQSNTCGSTAIGLAPRRRSHRWHRVCDRQKEFALDRPNGRYRLDELSSTSTSQIKHGAKSLDSDPGILACSRNRAELVDSLSCASKRRGLASWSRASGVGPKLSRHFRMSRPAGLNIIAGHALIFRRSVSAPWQSTYPPIEHSRPRLGHYPPSATNPCRWSTRCSFCPASAAFSEQC